MFYVLCACKDNYSIYETNTESSTVISEDYLKKMIKEYKMEFKNIYLQNDDLKLKDWISGDIENAENSTVILKTNEGTFKVVSHMNSESYITEDKLRRAIKEGRINNAIITDKDEVKVIGELHTKYDKDFESHIQNEYSKFIAKSKLLGGSMDFKYNIEGNEVQLVDYTGTNKNPVIPSFITSICNGAFGFTTIESIRLNNGLRFIGKQAFWRSAIKCIDIPESVEFVYKSSFYWMENLLKNKGTEIDMSRINFRNKETIMFTEESI